ncbi:MAG TPA: twin-arginine translocase subunit TatC [Bryobacteraceae bacterium]|nr:twin-arginine translocase subunit TatC [Bryobacteraceae bacterium]
MAFPDDPKGDQTPPSESSSPSEGDSSPPSELPPHPHERIEPEHLEPLGGVPETNATEPAQQVTGEVVNDWSANHPGSAISLTPEAPPASPVSGGTFRPPDPPPPPPTVEEEEEEEDGMARMSFLEHLEELRKRLLLALAGIGVAFMLCLIFSDELWKIVFTPAETALKALHVFPPTLKLISPTDAFQIMWMKVPILFACFLSAPWILYQVWAFIAPGLYKHERRYAAPFVISSAGLFILGGFFAYFVAFRFGLEFLLGMGIGKGVDPSVSINEYYDLFVDIMLGVGIVFEIPILLFLLTLVRIVNPGFLVRHSRYAILGIVILAAVITPTGDVFNLAIFATPMIVLFYVGILASYMLVLKREKRKFPWAKILSIIAGALVVILVTMFFIGSHYGLHFVERWPFFVK